MKSLKWEGIGTKNLFPHTSTSNLQRPRTSGVVSGTTVRALVLGRFGQKKLRLELKDNDKK